VIIRMLTPSLGPMAWCATVASAAAESPGLPDPHSPLAVGWIVITLAGVLLIVERAVALVRGFRRVPAIDAEFATKAEAKDLAVRMRENDEKVRRDTQADLRRIENHILTREEFTAYREERSRDIARLEVSLSKVQSSVETSSAAQYQARRQMHSKINAHDAALFFLAGQMTERGETRGVQLREILRRAETEIAQ
jgi:hypothetical protein